MFQEILRLIDGLRPAPESNASVTTASARESAHWHSPWTPQRGSNGTTGVRQELREPALYEFVGIAYYQSSPNLAFAAANFAERVAGNPTTSSFIRLLRRFGFCMTAGATPFQGCFPRLLDHRFVCLTTPPILKGQAIPFVIAQLTTLLGGQPCARRRHKDETTQNDGKRNGEGDSARRWVVSHIHLVWGPGT
jgi:hypothetical protein